MHTKRVMPFKKQYHADNNYIFWADQPKAHYAKSVINYLNKNKVNFVRKNDNPVNSGVNRGLWAVRGAPGDTIMT